ncbi:MAG: hypothetical protein LUH48_03810, partial [Clostridiales bacterium]|nr:hypothetical protein [Clostridiales bacterium]
YLVLRFVSRCLIYKIHASLSALVDSLIIISGAPPIVKPLFAGFFRFFRVGFGDRPFLSPFCPTPGATEQACLRHLAIALRQTPQPA